MLNHLDSDSEPEPAESIKKDAIFSAVHIKTLACDLTQG